MLASPRHYLPIDYFEPSKLLEACAQKQGTKVFPGQTLIDVVLKDGRFRFGGMFWWFWVGGEMRDVKHYLFPLLDCEFPDLEICLRLGSVKLASVYGDFM